MSTLVCIPVFRVKCKVQVDQGRAWTPLEELVLWAISRRAQSIADLVLEANLPHQMVVAALSRLMRFRFAKVTRVDGLVKFVASDFGSKVVASGEPLPFFPKRNEAWVSFVIERVTGRVLRTRDVRRILQRDLLRRQQARINSRTITLAVRGDALDASQDAMIGRIAQFVTRGREERLAHIEPGTATRTDEFIGVTVDNGAVRDLPESAGQTLRDVVLSVAGNTTNMGTVTVPFGGAIAPPVVEAPVSCTFDPEDIVIGGSAQHRLLLDLIDKAASRLIVHSTFIDLNDVEKLLPALRAACARDVTVDILWGAAHGDEAKSRYAKTAGDLQAVVRSDQVLHRRVTIALQSSGSHAKLLLLDTRQDGWLAAVSSCNWLKSPFRSVEITTLLRHPYLVARVAAALQGMTGERGLSDALANEMALLRRDLASQRGQAGGAEVDVIAGTRHDDLMRLASMQARHRLVIGMHKLGATARPGALLPAEAASRQAPSVTVLYTQTTGPLKNRHARDLAKEAAAHGVRLIGTGKIPLHGKFLLWDEDDVVTSSLNWGSASADPDFPLGDIGIHVRAEGIGKNVASRLLEIFPELGNGFADAA